MNNSHGELLNENNAHFEEEITDYGISYIKATKK